jgi:hypothetical protein
VQYGEKSGVGISTTGLGGKPSGDLALRRLASAVLNTAMLDLMDEEQQPSATMKNNNRLLQNFFIRGV